MNLDLRTLAFVASITSLILFLWMWGISVSRKSYPGFHHWTISAFLFFVAMELISLRGIIDDAFTIVVANTSFILAFAMIDHGLRIFTGSKPTWWFYGITAGLLAALFFYYTFIDPEVSLRIVVVSLLVVLYCVRLAWHVHRKLGSVLKEKNVLLLTVFACLALWDLTRSVFTLIYEPNIKDFMTSGLFQSMTLLVFNCGTILIYAGLVVANAQRLELELKAALEDVRTLTGFLPMCANCKSVRDVSGYWNEIEQYLQIHTTAVTTHSICPNCAQKLYPELFEKAAESIRTKNDKGDQIAG